MADTFFGSGIKLAGGFDVSAQIPLDHRTWRSDWSEATQKAIPVTILHTGIHIYSDADKIERILTFIPANAQTAFDCTWQKMGAGARVILTEAAYEALVLAGNVDDELLYYTYDPDEETPDTPVTPPSDNPSGDNHNGISGDTIIVTGVIDGDTIKIYGSIDQTNTIITFGLN